jgi:ABC-type transport system involved in multi-copper enzyme maturation permease subunit
MIENTKYIFSGLGSRGITITSITIKRLLYSKKTIVILLLCAIPIILSLYWLTLEDESGYYFFSALIYVSYLFFIVVIIALLYGVSVFHDEINDSTINYLISRPIHRVELVIYKYVGLVISALVVVLPPLILTYLIIAPKAGAPIQNIGILTNYMGVVILAIVGYGAIFMFFGLLFKRPMLISLFYMFVWESVLAGIALLINQITIRHYLESIILNNIGQGEIEGLFQPADSITSIIIILSVTSVFLILSAIAAKSKDFA